MSGSHSRTKGSAAERELIRLIYDELGIRMQRRLDQPRSGGFDLELADTELSVLAERVGRLGIEVKRAAAASPGLILQWWRQTRAQAQAALRTPCLAFRVDRAGWQFVLPLSEINPDMPRTLWFGDSMDGCAVLTLIGWATVMRETG